MSIETSRTPEFSQAAIVVQDLRALLGDSRVMTSEAAREQHSHGVAYLASGFRTSSSIRTRMKKLRQSSEFVLWRTCRSSHLARVPR